MTHKGQRLRHPHTQNRTFLFKCARWSYMLGRHYIGIEKIWKYCRSARERLASLRGGKGNIVSTNQSAV